jgi:transcriptional regulator with XRE-family HTH domain
LTLCNWCPRSANAMRHRNIIGPQVRRLRNQRGWSQEQLAAKLQIAGWDVSRNGLAKIETRIQWMRDYQLAYLLNVFVSITQISTRLHSTRVEDVWTIG